MKNKSILTRGESIRNAAICRRIRFSTDQGCEIELEGGVYVLPALAIAINEHWRHRTIIWNRLVIGKTVSVSLLPSAS